MFLEEKQVCQRLTLLGYRPPPPALNSPLPIYTTQVDRGTVSGLVKSLRVRFVPSLDHSLSRVGCSFHNPSRLTITQEIAGNESGYKLSLSE